MKQRLFWKFLIVYILIGISGFILIVTLGSRVTEQALVDTRSMALYREASRVATYRLPATIPERVRWKTPAVPWLPWRTFRNHRSGWSARTGKFF